MANDLKDIEREWRLDVQRSRNRVLRAREGAAMAAGKYHVNVYDCAGLYRETPCASFLGALLVYYAERKRFPGKVVCVSNYDRVDLGCADGLTEDERDTLDEPAAGAP